MTSPQFRGDPCQVTKKEASKEEYVAAMQGMETATIDVRELDALLASTEPQVVIDLRGNSEEESYEELVVLDKAGRVHIPQEFLTELKIGKRARLELTSEGVLVRPVEGEGDEVEDADVGEATAVDEPKAGRMGKFMDRFKRGSKKQAVEDTE